MENLKIQCRSTDLLLKSVEKLVEALNSPYEPLPTDPSGEYCNAALSVVFFCKCVLRELIEIKEYDMKGTGALRLAISLGDIESTRVLLKDEIEEIISEDPGYQDEFLAEIRKEMTQMYLGEQWLNMLSQGPP